MIICYAVTVLSSCAYASNAKYQLYRAKFTLCYTCGYTQPYYLPTVLIYCIIVCGYLQVFYVLSICLMSNNAIKQHGSVVYVEIAPNRYALPKILPLKITIFVYDDY